MAKKSSKKKKEVVKTNEQVLYDKVVQGKEDSLTAYKTVRDGFDEKEAILVGTLQDEYSTIAKSKVSDPRLATIVIERAARVMAQNPKGRSMAIGNNDLGKNQLMNLTIDKYVLPNANSQFSYLMKSRMWDLYSQVYGVMFKLVDWRVDTKTGYVGPDTWLLPIRDCYPQPGMMSVDDSDKFTTSTMVGRNYLQSLGKGWNHIDELIAKLDAGEGVSKDGDDEKESHVESERNQTGGNSIEFITEYRTYGGKDDKGQWITVSPQLPGKILRQMDNPHKNGKLPIVPKYCFPLIDSIYGLGEFERGKTLQYAINSLINLYMDGVKMSIFPPVMINPDGVVRSSIKFGPAEKWLVKSMDAVKQFNLNPQGLQTFNSTYSFLIAAIMNQAGTTTTNTSDKVDPGMGRTPQALKMLENREGSRDAWDSFMMDQAQQEVLKRFTNLISLKQSSKITMRLFEDEIKKIKQSHPDVKEFISDNEVGVKSDAFGKQLYDYQIVSGSTAQVDQEQQFEALKSTLNTYLEFPQLQQALNSKGKDLDIGELYTRMISQSRINDWDKIIIDAQPQGQIPPEAAQTSIPQGPQPGVTPGQPSGTAPQFSDPEVAQAAQQLQALIGGMGGIPPTP